MKSFKYRLYPTKEQTTHLEWTLSRCCELYNAALAERKEAWNAAKRHPNFYDPEWRSSEQARDYHMSFAEQCRSLTESRNEIRPEYQQIGSHVLQNVLHRVDNAFQAFFRRVKCGQTPSYPRYQKIPARSVAVASAKDRIKISMSAPTSALIVVWCSIEIIMQR